MARDNRQQVRRVFMDVADLPEVDRAAALAKACGDDAMLSAEVEALLRAERQAGGFMGSPTSEVGGSDVTVVPLANPVHRNRSAVPTEHEGQMIGRYKLLQPIGEGGFGSVWMAEQREPVKRRVALKIIKLGMDTKQVIARFEAERQALAMMDHPNIAKVLDAGATEAGRPYFVMEYIKGVPILEYCDTSKLDTRARLELFGSVCHAIQHAHQKGIIHRDIKPSNVLVTMHDGVPVPRVIDFGIAKATSSELTTKTLFTEHRQMIGTPAYMSPEQAEMSGLDIDTRSDIYSLGVLLYELLTGTTPFDSKSLMEAGYAEMMRIIREDEPHKPSTRLSSLGQTGTRTAQQRHAGDVRKLGLILRGDLDWIVMKCLEKDRTRRYETANGLAADIQRHLKDEPVTAGAPSAGYKLRKFVKRNRLQVIAGCVVAGAMVLGVVGASTGMVWALNEKTRANKAKEEEAKARQRAETIVEFVTTALKASDAQNAGGGQDMTILAAMDNAIADIDSGRFKDDPLTEAELRGTIATILINNGRVAEAEQLATQVLEACRRLFPGDNPSVANCLDNLARARRAMGRAAEAESLLVQAMEMRRRLYQGDHADVASGLNNLADVLNGLGRYEEAESLFVQSMDMTRRLYAGDHPNVATSLNNVAHVRVLLHRAAEAEPLMEQALAMQQRLFKGDNPDVAMSLDNLAKVRLDSGRVAEAESLLVQALEMRRRLYKGDHPDLAIGLNNLAGARRSLGRTAEIVPLLVESLEMRKRLFKGDHPDVAQGLSNLGLVLVQLNRDAEAEPLLAQALAMEQRLFKGDHPDIADSLCWLANVRLTLDRATEAEPLFALSLEMWQRLSKGDSLEVAAVLGYQARARQALGKTTEARKGFDQAISMLRRYLPDGSAQLSRVLWRSARARLESKDAAAALLELEEAVAIADKVLPPDHPQLKEYRASLAECRATMGR